MDIPVTKNLLEWFNLEVNVERDRQAKKNT